MEDFLIFCGPLRISELYLKVDIHDIAVTGLSECCNNFKQVLVGTSHTRTVQPAALKAIGKARSTPVTGPEWPVKVQTGVVGEPVNHLFDVIYIEIYSI